MAIKISNTTVIDDSKNFIIEDITFADSTVQTFAGGDPAGGVTKYTAGELLYTLDNPNVFGTSLDDNFAVSMAASGNYVIIGAYREDNTYGTDSGMAYIFDATTGTLLHTLTDPNVYSNPRYDYFGSNVAIDGNFAIVSASGEDELSGTQSGKAYIYDVITGTLLHTLDNPNAYNSVSADSFGSSVAISGNYAIVAAYTEDEAGGSDSGIVYLYDVTTGSLLHALINPNLYNTPALDQFGANIAMSGNYAIVCSRLEDSASGATSGAAYVFDVTTASLLYTITNPSAYSTSAGDNFGYSVAAGGNYAIVGAIAEDDTSGTSSGKAYIFDLRTGTLLHTLDNPNAYSTGTSDNFGISVAINSRYAAVGAWYEDDPSGTQSGKAYIYDVITGTLLHTLDNPNAYSTSLADNFGGSIALTGTYVIVGARLEDDALGTTSGKAYTFTATDIYDLNSIEKITFSNGFELSQDHPLMQKTASQNWSNIQLLHVLNNPDISTNEFFGKGVAVSDLYTIVSAQNSTIGGRAHVYNTKTGSFLYTIDNPNVYSTGSDNDVFAQSVAISGKYALLPANAEDSATGDNSGVVYIFDLTTNTLLHTLYNPNAYSTVVEDKFGWRVGISGTRAIISTNVEDDAAGSGSGKAYIFDVITGTLLHTLDNPNGYSTGTGDTFGSSVGISGNYAIVGAYQEDDADGLGSGKAYIFDVRTGTLLHTLDNPNAYSTSASDQFGNAVAISGNYAIVGVKYEDDIGGTSAGKAYIFDVLTGALLHTLRNPNKHIGNGFSDSFGSSVAIHGNYAIVTAVGEGDETTGISGLSGKVYVYDVTTGLLLSTIDNPNIYGTSASDMFGDPVAVSGNYIVAGATGEDEVDSYTAGRAYIFKPTIEERPLLDKVLDLIPNS